MCSGQVTFMQVLNKSRQFNEKGMTLIEVMASLVILALISTTVAAVFTPASKWVKEARSETTASNYARAVLENLRADRTKIILSNNEKTADELWPAYMYHPPGMTAKICIKASGVNGLYEVTVKVKRSDINEDLEVRTLIRGS